MEHIPFPATPILVQIHNPVVLYVTQVHFVDPEQLPQFHIGHHHHSHVNSTSYSLRQRRHSVIDSQSVHTHDEGADHGSERSVVGDKHLF